MGIGRSKDTFDESKIVPQGGRVFLVTGSNTGIGYETALILAQNGARVIMCSRDRQRGQAALETMKTSLPADAQNNVFLELLDLNRLESVRSFAARAVARTPPAFVDGIDVVILNAGVMTPPTRQLSADGFENQWSSNHLGHFALVGLLLPLLRQSTRTPTVVPVSSILARKGKLHLRLKSSGTAQPDFDASSAKYDPDAIYANTKQANLLYAVELHKRHGSWLRVVPCHPGVCATNLFQYSGYSYVSCVFQKARDGALLELRAALDPLIAPMTYIGTGDRLRGAPEIEEPAPYCVDPATALWLWDASEKATSVHY